MNRLLIFGIVGIFTLSSCYKEEPEAPEEIQFPCGTEFIEPEWVATLSDASLEGNWSLVEIRYVRLKDLCTEADRTIKSHRNVVFSSDNKGTIDQDESFSWNLEPYVQYHRWLKLGNFNTIFPADLGVGFEKDGIIRAEVYDAFMESDEEKELVLKISQHHDSEVYETARLYFRKNE